MSIYEKTWIYRTHGYINQATLLGVRYEQKQLHRPVALRMARWKFSFGPIMEGHINV